MAQRDFIYLPPDSIDNAFHSQSDYYDKDKKSFTPRDDFERLLEAYRSQLNGGDERYELMRDLLDYRKSLLLRDNQRDWETQWRDNQRAYDAPSSELARLMATGLSRDAALQLLGSSAGGAGALSPSAISPTQTAVTPPSVGLNAFTAQLQQGAANIGQLVLGAAQLGLSAPAQMSLADLQSVNAQAVQSNLQSLSAIGQFDALVQDARANGVQFSNQYENPDAFYAECANSSYAPLANFVKQGGLTRIKSMPTGSQNLNAWFRDNIDTDAHHNNAKYLANQVRLADANVRFTETQIDDLCTMITQHQEETKSIIQDRINSIEITRANVNKADAEIKLMGQQIEESKAHSSYLSSLAIGQDYENAIVHPSAQAALNLDDALTQYQIDQFNTEMRMWRYTAGNPKVQRVMIEDYLTSVKNQHTFLACVLADTQEMRAFQTDGNMLGKSHNFYGLTQWLRNSGVGDVAEDVLKGVGSNLTLYYLLRSGGRSQKPYQQPRTTVTGGEMTTTSVYY